MKKLVCVILAVIFVFSLTACNKETSQKKIMSDSTSDQLATTVKYPVPVTLTYEESENNLGARYTFTLKEFNEMLNSACKNLGTSEIEEFFDYSNWCVMSDNLTDDNGIKYSSYYYATDTLTISAAVENESGKVMNLGCGTSYEEFASADADYQYTVMLTSAIIAMVAGGYTEEDLEFLYCIYFDSAKNNEKFYYHNGVYMMNISKSKDEEGSALLFMTSPCQEEIKTSWELVDYRDYDGSYKTEN
ncbi:MAG: hypothetical protein IJ015_02835 [Ruminococcus sp.]|nr:hypothetical protein [Ruminococcus sp.]